MRYFPIVAGLAVLIALVSAPAWAVVGQPPEGAVCPPKQQMNLLQAVVLGAVEGITEYLPVSSTGHLLIAQKLMGTDGKTESDKAAADAYAICIQGGAILAVLGLYFKRARSVLMGLIGRDPVGLKLGRNLLVAFLPAVVLAVALEDLIKHYLFTAWPIVAAWFVGGIVVLLIAKRTQANKDTGTGVEDLSVKQSFFIGLAQCLAMWPGVSRSLATIVGGTLSGLTLDAAVEFSFLLGVITLGAATSYDALKHGASIISCFGWVNPLVGFVCALVFALLAVKWMVGYLNKHGIGIFGYYRIAAAIVAGALILGGVISASV